MVGLALPSVEPSHLEGLTAGRRTRPGVSLLRSSPAFVLLAIIAASADNFADPDLWRHVLVGQVILHTWRLPVSDPYSYTAFGHLWRNHEWLAQTVMALFYDSFHVLGLKLLKLICAAATISFLAAGMAETEAPARIQRSILILIALALAPQMQFRPQLFSYALLGLLFALLARETYRGPAQLWTAIPVFALWANLHGGYIVGLGALAAYTAVSVVHDISRRRRLWPNTRLAAIVVGCTAATLVNPLGMSIWPNVLHSVTDPAVKAAILEWQPLLAMLARQLHASIAGAVIYIIPILLFAALTISIVMAPPLDDAALILVAAFFAAGAFYAVRNMALAVIAVAIPLTRHAGLVAIKRSRREDAPEADRGFNPALAVSLAVLLALLGGLFSTRLKAGFKCPAAAVSFMKQHRLHGNILCDFSWGEYLLWHMTPQSKVFIDGRWELVYPHNVMREYIRFDGGTADAKAVLKEYPHDFVLIPPTSRAYRIVFEDPQWKIVYRDPVAVLFARSSSPAAQTPNNPVIGPASPGLFP